MFRSRLFLKLALVVALFLVVPALTSAQKPRHIKTSLSRVYYCPSAGLYFICTPSQGPDCPCNSCPDYC
jgi:hypothetical protein